MELLVLAFALYFLYLALVHFLTLMKASDPGKTVVLLVYCLVVGFYLIWADGLLHTLN